MSHKAKDAKAHQSTSLQPCCAEGDATNHQQTSEFGGHV